MRVGGAGGVGVDALVRPLAVEWVRANFDGERSRAPRDAAQRQPSVAG